MLCLAVSWRVLPTRPALHVWEFSQRFARVIVIDCVPVCAVCPRQTRWSSTKHDALVRWFELHAALNFARQSRAIIRTK